MKRKLLQILSCPYDENTYLELKIKREKNEVITEGVLMCQKCGRVFPIINKIPYLLPDDLKGKKSVVNEFFAQNKEYKNVAKYYIHKNTDDFDGQEGARTWKPDITSKVLTVFRMKNPPNLIKNYFSSSSFTLDIGCGEAAKGDINIDIYLPAKIPKVFILASAEYLPFQSNVFDLVFSSYVIEHCLNPSRFIENQIRCSKDRVIIIADNCEWIGDYWFRLSGNGRIFHDEHCYAWTVEYLENLIRRLGYRSEVQACNLSPTYVVALFSGLGKLPRVGRFFCRDIVVEISK